MMNFLGNVEQNKKVQFRSMLEGGAPLVEVGEVRRRKELTAVTECQDLEIADAARV
jgi:hypothetical protein